MYWQNCLLTSGNSHSVARLHPDTLTQTDKMLTWAQNIYFQESSSKRTEQFYISDDWNSCSWVCFCWCTAIMLMHVLCIFFWQFWMPHMHIFKSVMHNVYIHLYRERRTTVQACPGSTEIFNPNFHPLFVKAWLVDWISTPIYYMCTNIKGLLSWPATNMNKSGINLAGLQSSHSSACALL